MVMYTWKDNRTTKRFRRQLNDKQNAEDVRKQHKLQQENETLEAAAC